MCLNCTPSSPKSHMCWLTFPHLFGAVSQNYQDAVSWTTSLILPQIKINSQFSSCAFFYVNKNIYLSRKCARLGKYPARNCLQAGKPLFSNQAKEQFSATYLTILIEMSLQTAMSQENLRASYLDYKNAKKQGPKSRKLAGNKKTW